jgi:hypothetical protein
MDDYFGGQREKLLYKLQKMDLFFVALAVIHLN